MCRFSRLLAVVACSAFVLVFVSWSLAWAADPVFVDDDFTAITPGWGVTHFATIQDGVDNVDPGGTVNVAAGTYEEQVEIDKNLELLGAGTGSTVVLAPVGMTKFFTTGSNDNYPVFFVHDASDVNIRDLTVDGAGRGNSNVRFMGFGYRNAGGDVDGCEIIDIRNTPIDGAQHGVAIYALADNGTARTLEVLDNDISGFQKNGMALIGADLTVSVSGNTVTGAGAVDFIAQNGIQVSGGATGTITGNTVAGFAYTPFTFAATGVLLFSASGAVATTSNIVDESLVGIWYIDTSGTIEDNTMASTVGGMGATPYWWFIIADPGPGNRPQPDPDPFDATGGGPAAASRGREATFALTTTVTGNTIDGGGNGTGIEADVFGTEILTFTAEENNITSCAFAFSLYKDAGATLNGTVFNNSADGSNGFGLENLTSVLQDASGNWWGSTDDATVAGLVSVGDVDYTPWLGSGTDTSGDPGFQGDFSSLYIDDDSPQVGSVDRVREAVALASGSTVTLAAGTYITSAQVVIDKDITMVGAGAASTTINKTFDTAASGDPRGWFLVETGFDFDLSDVTLDGTGFLVYQAIRNKGEGSITDVVFTEIKYNESGPHYSGIACAAFGTGPVDVSGCTFSEIGRIGILYFGTGPSGSTFSNNTYTGKGAGDWLDYALDISAGVDVTVEDNDVSDNLGVASVDGSTSAGFLVTTFFAGGTAATITGNIISGCTTGIAVGFDSSDTSDVEAHRNCIVGNSTGVSSTSGPLVDAINNWWGDATGPFHATLNAGGLGDPVTDDVLFDPWMIAKNEVSIVPDPGITNCSTNISFTFHIDRAGIEEMRGYEVIFEIDDAVVTVANVGTDFTEDPYLSDVGSTAFFAIDNGGGSYTVSNAILGGSVGATGAGDLFTVEFTPVAEGTSDITITSLQARDLDNVPLDIDGFDGTVQVDCTVPTMDFPLVEAENVCYNTAPTFSVFRFNDDVNLDMAEFQIDAGGFMTIFAGIDTTDFNGDGFVLPGFGPLSQGAHTVFFRVKDDAGNENGEGTPDTYSWDFIKDTVAPSPPTGFVALPGHNKVHLTWTNPVGDPSFAGVEIRRVGWGDYPEFGTPGPAAPSYPANQTEGDFVVKEAGEAHDDSITTRDIYFFSAFSCDCAANYSVFSVNARDNSTSYFLGDIAPSGSENGLINILDLAPFSIAFGESDGDGGWNPFSDFGPTDDFSRFGIPLPDNTTDFEDLIIFAMNFGNVSPTLLPEALVVESQVALVDAVSFLLVPLESDGNTVTFAVTIENEAALLKGFALDIDYGPANQLVDIRPGAALAGQSETFFGTISGDLGKVQVCVAALGVRQPLRLSGEVARLRVRLSSATAGVRLEKIDLRDVNNNKEEITFDDEPAKVPFVPTTTALLQNHPNPFNPTTTITYDIATPSQVTIEIFVVSGQRVRTLVNGYQEVGRHEVTWDGRDARGNLASSGFYFYRMTAGDAVSSTKKMLLIK